MSYKIAGTALGCLLSFSAIAAAPNPATQEWVSQQLTSSGTPQGALTSAAWVSACPSGAAGLLTGCFNDGISVGATPLGVFINSMWTAVNTTPSSAPNSVYIKKFPAGYVLTANSGRNLTFDATGIPATSMAWCSSDPMSESGMDLDNSIANNPTLTTGSQAIYNVSMWATSIDSGDTNGATILRNAPGTSGALPLGIPIYVVCIGTNTTTGSPASIAGITVS